MSNWKAIEALGYVYYLQKGYRILVSLIEGKYYDFVAEKDGKFARVNVKKATKDKRSNSYSISLSGSARIEKDLVDVFLAWIPEKKNFIEVHGNFFYEVNAKTRVIPASIIKSLPPKGDRRKDEKKKQGSKTLN